MKREIALYPTFELDPTTLPARYELAVQLALIAEKMKDFGILVDRATALAHAAAAQERKVLFQELFLSLTGLAREDLGGKGEGSTKAVKEWFKAMGAPDVVFAKDTGKAQFNATAFNCWATDYAGQPFARPAAALLGIRKAATARRSAQAYYDVALHDPEGRVHFDFNTLGTKGERWSSSAKFMWENEEGELVKLSLNAQNIAAKKQKYDFGEGYGKLDLMVSLWDCFVPDPGCVAWQADFEGAEGRLIGYVTGAAAIIKCIEEDRDLHSQTARALFLEYNLPAAPDKLGKDMSPHGVKWSVFRDAAKPCTYGFTYSVTKEGAEEIHVKEVWKQLKQFFPNISEEYVQVLAKRYYQYVPEVLDFHRSRHEAAKLGYGVLPQTGRQLYIPDTMKGKNKLANFPFQSGLGSLINRAMPPIARRMDWKRMQAALTLQVHDSLAGQFPRDRAEELSAMVSAELQRPANFGGHEAFIPAKCVLGENYGETK